MSGLVPARWTLSALACVGCAACGPIDVFLAPPESGYQWVIPSFEVPRGTETQRCFFVDVPSEVPVYVNRVEIAQNSGTHHMNIFRVNTIKNLDAPPGESVVDGECWVSANWSDWPLVANSQESNAGSPNPDDPSNDGYSQMLLPGGVALKFAPHEKLMLQTHYVNATTQSTPLSGKVFVNFHSVDPSAVDSELGTLFATNQSIKICPGETGKYFETACQIADDRPVTLFAANSHFHSRGTYFSMSVLDRAAGVVSPAFYESRVWDDPPMVTGLDLRVPALGAVQYHCEFSVPASACGDPDKNCCFTFGGKVETQEHCNIFVYYYPKTRDFGCF